VRQEIKTLQAYFTRQITRYRITRAIVIVSAALVPVLATAAPVPRWVLAAFGALAAVVEGMQGLFQYRASALNAMRTANALERVLNKYMTAVAPYEGPTVTSFPVLVREIEAIRKDADETFLHTWQATEIRDTPATDAKGRLSSSLTLDARWGSPPMRGPGLAERCTEIWVIGVPSWGVLTLRSAHSADLNLRS
jgi:hypothetical protein